MGALPAPCQRPASLLLAAATTTAHYGSRCPASSLLPRARQEGRAASGSASTFVPACQYQGHGLAGQCGAVSAHTHVRSYVTHTLTIIITMTS